MKTVFSDFSLLIFVPVHNLNNYKKLLDKHLPRMFQEM